MRKSVILSGVVAIFGLAACGDELDVPNQGGPDVDRVYATARGVEAAVGGFYAQAFNPMKASESVAQQSKILAEETFSSVANFGNAARDAIRNRVNNEIGNDLASSNSANYFSFQRLSRSILNALHAFKLLEDAQPTSLNTLTPDATNRVRAFAYFVLANTYANVSFAYDSGAIADETINTLDIPELVGSAEVHAAALVAYDSAITIATRGMDVLPGTWINGTSPAVDQARFIRIVRSYRARARAGHARTAAERDALDWAAIRDDATNGLTEDLQLNVGGTSGLSITMGQMYTIGGWHQFPMRYIGMADSSGEYQAWSAATNKRAFLVRTSDGRWPTGSTRALQQASTPDNLILPRYIRNRPTGDDVTIARPGESQYDHRRWGATVASSQAAAYTEMSKTEIDMLAAEAHIRLGQPALAEPLIDISRVRNGLPSVVGVGAGVVPGGAACVPKLPSGACGSLFEAMKYEKRMETAHTGYMQFFLDARGWGDLLPNTLIEWPVPYQEMQYRGHPFYDGERTSPATNTYGFTN